MTPAERKLLVAIARAVPPPQHQDMIAALEAIRLEDAQQQGRCGVVGYPGGERHVCELDAWIVHEYHQDGRVRWIGYFASPEDDLRAASDELESRLRDLAPQGGLGSSILRPALDRLRRVVEGKRS